MAPSFAAPERYQWFRGGAAADIYSCGAVLYYCLTGTLPPDAVQRLAGCAMSSVDAIRPEVSKQTSDAVAKALDVRISQRWRSMDEFVAALAAEQAPSTDQARLWVLICAQTIDWLAVISVVEFIRFVSGLADTESQMLIFFLGIAAVALAAFMEAAMLAAWGTTPGRALFRVPSAQPPLWLDS